MRTLVFCLSMALLAGAALPDPGGQPPRLQLALRDGRVTIIARDVPLTDLLAEWSRLGQTRIVNAEKLAGPRLTIELVDVSERDALDILLRSAAGYIAAPRPADRPGTSRYDRVTILASSRAPAAAAVSAPPESPRASSASPSYPAAAAAPAAPAQEQPADPDPTPDFTSPQGGQPIPQVRPVVTPLPGMQPQLEASQPRGVKLSDLLRNAGEQAGPMTSPRPGAVPVPGRGYPNPYNAPPGPGGRGGGQ
jgi:hypothetical protein